MHHTLRPYFSKFSIIFYAVFSLPNASFYLLYKITAVKYLFSIFYSIDGYSYQDEVNNETLCGVILANLRPHSGTNPLLADHLQWHARQQQQQQQQQHQQQQQQQHGKRD